MPFCRECGNEVQDGWNNCPHCSCSLNHSSQNVSLNDSVIGGDVISNTNIQSSVNINDADTISAAIKSASECVSCGSVSETQITCSRCKKMSHCNICILEISSLRQTKRLCIDCEKIVFQELETERLQQLEWEKMRQIAERQNHEEKVEEAKRNSWKPPITFIIAIIFMSWIIWINIEMSNFCEDNFDPETSTFENGRDFLPDEGPYGADCTYTGPDEFGKEGVSYRWHLNENVLCFGIPLLFLGFYHWWFRYRYYVDLKNKHN